MSKLRNILLGAGVAAVGAIGTKKVVDYFRNRDRLRLRDKLFFPFQSDLPHSSVYFSTTQYVLISCSLYCFYKQSLN